MLVGCAPARCRDLQRKSFGFHELRDLWVLPGSRPMEVRLKFVYSRFLPATLVTLVTPSVVRQALKLSILIVDDHLLIRLGLKQVLGLEFRDVVFGEAETAAEALAQIKAKPWRLVILDVSLPDDDDGLSVLREVCIHRPQAAVLVLGMHPDSQYTPRSLQLGASGYISKSSGRSDLLKAVSNVLDGKKHFSESVRLEVRSQSSAAPHADLSAQEYKVL